MFFWKKLNNRARILVLLLASLVLLNIIVLVTTQNLKVFSGSFASMLNDRLVPSTDITFIQEYANKNRLLLEHFIFRDNTSGNKKKIEENNQLLDSTFDKFAHTHFTDEESEHAQNFLQALKRYRNNEQQILRFLDQNNQDAAEQLFEGEGNMAFQEMIHELHILSGIQLTVGKLLYEHSEGKIQLVKLVAYFSMVVSLVVAAQTLKVLGINPR